VASDLIGASGQRNDARAEFLRRRHRVESAVKFRAVGTGELGCKACEQGAMVDVRHPGTVVPGCLRVSEW